MLRHPNTRTLLLYALPTLLSAAQVAAQEHSQPTATTATLRRITLRADDTSRLARAEISTSDARTVVTVSDSTGGTTVAANKMLVRAPVVLTFPDEAFQITVVNLDANVYVEMPSMPDRAGARFRSEFRGPRVVFTRAAAGAAITVEAQQVTSSSIPQQHAMK